MGKLLEYSGFLRHKVLVDTFVFLTKRSFPVHVQQSQKPWMVLEGLDHFLYVNSSSVLRVNLLQGQCSIC